jgi:hypothetical protein
MTLKKDLPVNATVTVPFQLSKGIYDKIPDKSKGLTLLYRGIYPVQVVKIL